MQTLFRSADYLDEFAATCDHAMAAAEPIVDDIRLGSAPIHLRFASPALAAAVMPALTHLHCPPPREPLALTVEVWDAAGGKALPPPFPQRGSRAPGRGEIRAFGDTDVYAQFQSGVQPRDGSFTAATFFDERASIARVFVREPVEIPWHERAAPLRNVLQWALTRPDRLLVHAGAVAVDGHGILLAGPSGSGKSTTAVAALLDGHDFLGDDYVFVQAPGSTACAHSIYSTAKLKPAATALLVGLPAEYRRPLAAGISKHVVDVGVLHPDRLRAAAPIEAIVIPEAGTGSGGGIRPVSAGAALKALAPTTVLQSPRDDGAALWPLAKLARETPAYVLELDGSAGVADALSEVLRR